MLRASKWKRDWKDAVEMKGSASIVIFSRKPHCVHLTIDCRKQHDPTKRMNTEDAAKARESALETVQQQLAQERKKRLALEQELSETRASFNHVVTERTREFDCLLQVIGLITHKETTLNSVFHGVVNLIPPAWQAPDTTFAHLLFEGQEYFSDHFEESSHWMEQTIVIDGEEKGKFTVFRTGDTEIAFLLEEKHLLGAIAQLLADAFVRNQAEEAWHRANLQLEEKVDERTRELAEARDQAEAANEAKSRFLANMSHEIRSPLNAILGFTQIMISQEKDINLPGNFGGYLNNIRVSGQNLSEIINDILDLSKIEAGRMTLYEEDLNLKQLIQGIYHIYKPQATEKGIDFNYAFLPGLPEIVRSDRTKIKQILVNLVSNAIKFTPSGRAVTIDALAEDEWLVLKVTDTGVGIPSNRLGSIFDPFVQADNSTTRQFGGTGLGLAISKKMVELLGGTIGVSSRVDLGSTFAARIPLVKAGITNYSEEDIHLAQFDFSPDNKVLVVEDNPMNREMIAALFLELGIQVDQAENGQEGVRKAYDLKPDLILMDIHMPVMDGLECTRRIRLIPECQEIPIVALSADAFKEQQRKAFEVGVSEYLPKPIDLNRLMPILLQTLKHLNQEESEMQVEESAQMTEEVLQAWNQHLAELGQIAIFETEQLIMQAEALEAIAKSWKRSALEKIEVLKASIYDGDAESVEKHIKKLAHESDSDR